MKYLGDFAEDATVRGSFNTRGADGAPITLAGTPTLAVYKDANVTESVVGVTLTVDFDARTGHHVYTIDTAADAFYATGSDYRVVITVGTVDGTSVVGAEVGTFSVQNRFAPSGSGLDAAGVRAAVGLATANLDTQLADIPTVAEFNARSLPSADYFVVGDYTAPPTSATIADAVWDEVISGHLTAGSTGASLNAAGGSGDPWTTTLPGAYTGSQAGKILADVLADTGTDGVVVAAGSKSGYSLTATTGLGNQTANITGTITTATNVTTVNGLAANVITATSIASNAITDAKIAAAALNGKGDWNIGKTGYTLTQAFPANFAALGINVSGHVSRVVLADTTTTNTDMRGTNSALLASGYTAPPTSATIADAVWDEVISGHLTAGSTGAALNAAGGSGDPWTTALPGAYSVGTAGYAIGTYIDSRISDTIQVGQSYTHTNDDTLEFAKVTITETI